MPEKIVTTKGSRMKNISHAIDRISIRQLSMFFSTVAAHTNTFDCVAYIFRSVLMFTVYINTTYLIDVRVPSHCASSYSFSFIPCLLLFIFLYPRRRYGSMHKCMNP